MSNDADRDALASSLSEALGGRVLRPGDDSFETVAALWSARRTHHPDLIALVAGAADVQRVLKAVPAEVPIAVRGGGHDWVGRAHVEGGITLDLSQMRGVQIDARAGTAKVQGGARLDDLIDAAAEHDLVAAVGTVNEVGFAGLALGGGYGPYLGTLGLAADTIISAEVVLADGSIVRASDEERADLLWALRGGGGNFGVVTSLEISLEEMPAMLAGAVVFSATELSEVLTSLERILPTVPDQLAVSPAIGSGPDGGAALLVSLNWNGEAGEGSEWVRAIERMGTPLASTIGPATPTQALHALDGMFPSGRHYTLRTASVATLTPAVIEILVDGERCRTSPLSAINIHHFHGAATRVGAEYSAWALREPHLMIEIIAATADAEGHDEQIAWADRILDALRPLALPAAYPNLLSPGDSARAAAIYGNNLARLNAVKRDVDPTGRFTGIPMGLPHRPLPGRADHQR
ncbi:FAD-binding oxidoreductase [Microbacterium sp. Sa4CUA7]|uniref:FAD-binding oxidoreductase n=1 Tax=Microbacterium pullorum TaxID=2762236 RepID=A0ABR8RZ26_9MICO|nr:FAD-binding oxidoreductase [Microbacterium pullorum]MBD7956483.1 FAD-binding oxidoreductase [Microbacterium pullorum]